MLEQAFVPARSTLGTRWIITAILSSPGITKSHGKNRDLSFIEEGRTIQPQASRAGDRRLRHSKVYRSDGPCSLAPDRRSTAERCSPAAPRGADRVAVLPHRSDKHERRATHVSATSKALCMDKYRSHPYRGFCQSMMSLGFIDIAISKAQVTFATARSACLKKSTYETMPRRRPLVANVTIRIFGLSG